MNISARIYTHNISIYIFTEHIEWKQYIDWVVIDLNKSLIQDKEIYIKDKPYPGTFGY